MAPGAGASERAAATPGIAKTTLPNGVRIVSEEMPGLASVALGIWVESGSRHEARARNGISHFLEHLVFKGTARRSAAAIAEEIDAVGGVLNADTDREYTCYYAKVLGEHFGLGIDLLADIFLNAEFAPEEIVREKAVVLEEIAEIEDTPDDHVHDLFHLTYWPDTALGLPVCGTPESVEAFDRDACLELVAQRYRPNRIVISAAGAIEHGRLVDEVSARFAALGGSASLGDGAAPAPRSGVAVYERRLSQVQVVLGTRGIPANDPAREVGLVLNSALGDSPSSRLFQEVRERRGRAYSVESFLCSYRDTGYLGVAAGTRPKWVAEVVEIILGELKRIRREGLGADELARAKGKLKGSVLLGLESSDHRMERLALNEMYAGRQVSPAETAARIDAVANEDVIALAERLFVPDACALVLLGNVKPDRVDGRVFDALS